MILNGDCDWGDAKLAATRPLCVCVEKDISRPLFDIVYVIFILCEADDLWNEGINPHAFTSDDICDDYHGDVFTVDEYVFIIQHFIAS